jgi:hypothetical protein
MGITDLRSSADQISDCSIGFPCDLDGMYNRRRGITSIIANPILKLQNENPNHSPAKDPMTIVSK